MKIFSFLILFGVSILPLLVHGEKTDILIMQNGDQITGEIKKLENGILNYSTDNTGLLKVKWDKISYLISLNDFEIHMKDGAVYYGSIDSTSIPENILVITDSTEHELLRLDVVELYPTKNKFANRINGSVDMGFTYTNASNVSQFTLNGNASYKRFKNEYLITYNGIITDQGGVRTTKKQAAKLVYSRSIKKRGFANGILGYDQNTAIGLASRYYAGAGIGYNILYRSLSLLSAVAGVQVNNETNTEQASKTSTEAYAGLTYKAFRNDDPKLNLVIIVLYYRSLSIPDRNRLNGDISLKWKVFGDFYWNFSFYVNYDSKPPSAIADTDDYGIITSIGFTF